MAGEDWTGILLCGILLLGSAVGVGRIGAG